MAIIPLSQFAAAIKAAGDTAKRAMELTIKDATNEAQRDAIKNAPRSPTQVQLNTLQKARYMAKHGTANGYSKHKAQGLARRKPNAHSRPAPGGIERSIKAKLTGKGANIDGVIYIASNAPAGKYAAKIHDEKGKTWRNRGIGTIRKGPQADDQFIKRAVDKAAKTLQERYQKIYERLTK